MSRGALIISFDCEGKWGVADHLDEAYQTLLTSSALRAVYQWLVECLDRLGLRATFAFTTAFTLSQAEWRANGALFDHLESFSPAWFQAFRQASKAGDFEGWFEPGCLAAVEGAGTHEIGFHGFSHQSLGSLTPASAVQAEFRASETIWRARGRTPPHAAVVFPRNDVGNLRTLEEFGVRCYRPALARPAGFAGRISGLLQEVNPAARAQEVPPQGGPVRATPAGSFFNWRKGARAWVPPAATVLRWNSIVDDACRTQRIAHLWLHPHNLITGPGTLPVLERVLAHAANAVREGRLENPTMSEFAARQAEIAAA